MNMSEFRIFDFGGETLMKWREPNAYARKRFPAMVTGFFFALIGIIVSAVVCIVKPSGQPVRNFFNCSGIISIVLLVSLLTSWFLPWGYVRLKESCVKRRAGKWVGRSNYHEIESATLRHEKYNDQKYAIIHLKLKTPKSWINTSVDQIVVPDYVNVEQVLQILRNKGVKCH
jgi:energy-coupling factor transporter transmembrane protein EcfT